jgi:hypothetical protein
MEAVFILPNHSLPQNKHVSGETIKNRRDDRGFNKPSFGQNPGYTLHILHRCNDRVKISGHTTKTPEPAVWTLQLFGAFDFHTE